MGDTWERAETVAAIAASDMTSVFAQIDETGMSGRLITLTRTSAAAATSAACGNSEWTVPTTAPSRWGSKEGFASRRSGSSSEFEKGVVMR